MKKLIVIILVLFLNLFLNACQREIYTITIDNGSEIVVLETSGLVDIEDPVREGYKFLGWTTSDGKDFYLQYIEEDIYLVAKWLKINEKCSLFYDPQGGDMPEEYPTKYLTGNELVLPVPTKKYHAFKGWYFDEEFNEGPFFTLPDTIKGTKTLYAYWEDIADYQSITYHLDGGVLNEELNRYIPGEFYRIPLPKKEGYFFRGWYLEEDFKTQIEVIDETFTEPLVLYAKWEEESLANAHISIYGDSISTFTGYLPDGYAPYYPNEWVDVKTVEDTWWYQAIKNVGAIFHSNSSYSNTGVVTTGGAPALSGLEQERIDTLQKDGQSPDIIIIFLGVNDCKRGIKASDFKHGYEQMLEKMKNTYPGCKFVLCTLNACTFSGDYEPLRQEYNEVIREIVNANNYYLAELDNVITEENKESYMANMLHPNKEGMMVIEEEVARVLKEIE